MDTKRAGNLVRALGLEGCDDLTCRNEADDRDACCFDRLAMLQIALRGTCAPQYTSIGRVSSCAAAKRQGASRTRRVAWEGLATIRISRATSCVERSVRSRLTKKHA